MSHADCCATLELLDSALALVQKSQAARSALRRRIRRLSLQLELLRVRLRQPATRLDRN
jgi:hypothetical protein